MDASTDSTGNEICSEILGIRPLSNEVPRQCCQLGRFVVVRKSQPNWWAINELYMDLGGNHPLSIPAQGRNGSTVVEG